MVTLVWPRTLNDPDVHPLLDEQRRGGVTSVVHPDVPNPGLLEDGFPHLPVLGALDRAAVAGGEHEVVILLAISRLEPLRGLDLAVCLEEREQLGRALKSELALAPSLAEDDAPVRVFWAPVGMARTVLETSSLEAGVPLLLAALFASGLCP